jgi:hypothetical protein
MTSRETVGHVLILIVIQPAEGVSKHWYYRKKPKYKMQYNLNPK